MDCTNVHNKLIFYLDNELPPEEHQAVEDHLSNCSQCSRLLEEFKTTYNLIADAPELTEDFTDQTMDKIFDGQTVQIQARQFVKFTRRIAAVILFMVISISAIILFNQKEDSAIAQSSSQEELFIDYYFADLEQYKLESYYSKENENKE